MKEFISKLILQKLKALFSRIKNEKLRLICEAYAEQIVPCVTQQLCSGRLDFKDIPLVLPSTLGEELNKIILKTAFVILDKVSSKLPAGEARDYFVQETKVIIEKGTSSLIDAGDWQEAVKAELKAQATGYAKDFSHQAIEKAKEKLPDNQLSAAICDEADALATDIIDAVASGQSAEALCAFAQERVLTVAKNQAASYAQATLDRQIDRAIDYAAQKARRQGRGQGRSKYNKRVDAYATKFKDCLKANSAYAVERIIYGGESIEAVLADCAKNSFAESAQTLVADGTRQLFETRVRDAAKSVHVKGKGSRKVNRQIDNVAGEFSSSLAGNVTANFMAVAKGEKSFKEATVDTAVATTKDSARNYIEKHGAELCKESIEAISKNVAKKIGNETVKQAVLKTGTSLANVNTLTTVAGAVYDIGQSFKSFIKGEITKAELLRQIGEKGSTACLSSLGATYGAGIGTLVGGPLGTVVGGAIGSMVGCMASGILYGSVLKAFEEEDAARLRAEQTHAFCEEAIRRMRSERVEFEKQAELLFKERQDAAMWGFREIENAVLQNDFDKFSAGLNRITNSFGKKLQFTNFEEFDKFMESDEDFDL